MAIIHFQEYLQLKDPIKNHYKHYFIAVVEEGRGDYRFRTAYSRIGRNPTENIKKFSTLSSVVDQARRVRSKKLTGGYSIAPIGCLDAVRNPPDWWKVDNSSRTECSGCGNEIDEEMCHCGDDRQDHSPFDHAFGPMGCVCHQAPAVEEPTKALGRKNAPWQF